MEGDITDYGLAADAAFGEAVWTNIGQCLDFGAAIRDAIERSKAAPPVATSKAPSRAVQIRARMLSGMADGIVRARCEQARIATELVSSRGELEGLLSDVISGKASEEDHRLLRGWRRELAGDAVIALAEGRIAVKAIPDPPYLQEVEL